MEATLTPAKTGLEGAANGKRSGLGAIRWHQERWASLSARRGHGQRGGRSACGGVRPTPPPPPPLPLTQTHSDLSPQAEICIVETAAKGTACRGEEGGGGVCVGGRRVKEGRAVGEVAGVGGGAVISFFFGGGVLAVHPLAKS